MEKGASAPFLCHHPQAGRRAPGPHEHDHGVLMICDPRLLTKSYGRRIWQSLPTMRRTREVAEVVGFFEKTA